MEKRENMHDALRIIERIIVENSLNSLYKERRQTKDLGERDRLTAKIEKLQEFLESLKVEEEE